MSAYFYTQKTQEKAKVFWCNKRYVSPLYVFCAVMAYMIAMAVYGCLCATDRVKEPDPSVSHTR